MFCDPRGYVRPRKPPPTSLIVLIVLLVLSATCINVMHRLLFRSQCLTSERIHCTTVFYSFFLSYRVPVCLLWATGFCQQFFCNFFIVHVGGKHSCVHMGGFRQIKLYLSKAIMHVVMNVSSNVFMNSCVVTVCNCKLDRFFFVIGRLYLSLSLRPI